MGKWILGLLCCSAFACSSSNAPGTSAPDEAAFVGDWIIDRPFHASYEASLYRFSANHSLQMLESCSVGEAESSAVGSVQRAGIRCEFGDVWQLADSDALEVTGQCDDNRSRDIRLLFPDSDGANLLGPTVEVGPVGGESGWSYGNFEWRWKKCTGPCSVDCSSHQPR